jgi:5-methylcytosine-specific restriction endonuclease McrA
LFWRETSSVASHARRKSTRATLTFHHLVPRSTGGSGDLFNLVTLYAMAATRHIIPSLRAALRAGQSSAAMRLGRWLGRDARNLEAEMNFNPRSVSLALPSSAAVSFLSAGW